MAHSAKQETEGLKMAGEERRMAEQSSSLGWAARAAQAFVPALSHHLLPDQRRKYDGDGESGCKLQEPM
jgi:hypothetical protein